MLRVNLVKIYNDATRAARKECNITLPEDPEYFSVINKYKAWRKEKKLKKTSGSPKKSRKTDSGSSDSEDSDQFSEPDTSSEETDIDNLSLEDRIRRAAYPKRSRLDVSREGAKGDVTPLGKAKKFALWKLKTAEQRKLFLKCERFFEVQHDVIVDRLEGVFRQTYYNIFQEEDLLLRYESCRGYQKTNFLFDLFATRIYKYSEAKIRQAEDEFHRMSQFPNQSGSDYVNAIEQKRELLRLMGINISNNQLKTRILMSLNWDYEEFFRFYLPHKISLEQFKADIRKADAKLNRKRKPNGNPRGGKPTKNPRTVPPENQQKPVEKPVAQVVKPRQKVKCYNCGAYGHISRDCKKPKRQQPSNGGQPNNFKKKQFGKPVGAVGVVDQEVNEDEVDLVLNSSKAVAQEGNDSGAESDATLTL